MPLVTSGRESGPKMLVPELKSSQRHPSISKELGETEVKSREVYQKVVLDCLWPCKITTTSYM